jgi:phosphate transport system protein
MPRNELNRRLDEIRSTVLDTGDRVHRALRLARNALAYPDRSLIEGIIAGDEIVDRTCAAIEAEAELAITLHQPAVGDLRAVLAALIIAQELERIGDHVASIARLTAQLPHVPEAEMISLLSALSAATEAQLRGALAAYRHGDVERAREVCRGDAAVDDQYRQFVQRILGMPHLEHDAIPLYTYLLWIAHNLERIADRATNICERVEFIATGKRAVLPG